MDSFPYLSKFQIQGLEKDVIWELISIFRKRKSNASFCRDVLGEGELCSHV